MLRRFAVASLVLLAFASSGSVAHAAPAAHAGAHPSLRRGATGAYVVEAQRRLNIWIQANRPGISLLPTTGYYGPLTETAVRRFQAASGLPVVGLVGPRTWAALPPDLTYCSAGGPCVTRTRIFLIALEDNGASGKRVGCGDSAVPVSVVIPPTPRPLAGALGVLLATRVRVLGESGLYNALHQSNLRLQSAIVQNGRATIRLAGSLSLGGVCDDPRFAAQIEETARQFSGVRTVSIFVNGVPLSRVLSGRG